MDKKENNQREYYTIDLMHILRSLLYRIWIIVLVGIIAAIAGFCYSSFAVQPDYSSSVLLYVNNSSINVGNTSFNISASDITASQSLVKTYTEILKNRTTLERIIDEAEVDYGYGQLNGMIQAGSSNDTEVMKVTVTCKDPYEAAKIANTIAEILPARISEIIDGASMEVVDSAIPIPQKIGPSITKYTALFMMLGIMVSVLCISIAAILDDTVHDEEYILQNYDYPILAKIPNLLDDASIGYGYNKYGYYNKKPTNNAKN